jgi:ankyrin repeat protein
MKNVPKPLIVYIITLSALLLAVMKVDVHASPDHDLREAIENGNLQAAQSALRNGADVNAQERYIPYRTNLMIAAEEGNENLAKLLVEYGADVNGIDADGHTALMEAANGGHLNVVKFLIEHGANVNAAATLSVDYTGSNTALMHASEKGHVNVVKLLIKHGADINAKNKNGDTALSFAENNSHTEVAHILREAGAK